MIDDTDYVNEPYLSRGLALRAQKEYDHALIDFSAAIKADSSSVEGYFDRGLTYQDKQDPANAIVDFTKVLKLEPGHPQAQMMRDYITKNSAARSTPDPIK